MAANTSVQPASTVRPSPRPRRIKPLWVAWFGLILVMMAFGLVCGLDVLINGLQVTNLTDQLPWGLWITMDLSSVALGTGAFTLTAFLYIFRMERYRAIARAAIVIGFIGYTCAMLVLIVDIGRFDRFYNPLIYWNPSSVLWGMTMGVIIYSMVLVVELVPIVIESTALIKVALLRRLAHLLHQIMPAIAVFGLGVSLIAQALYGASFGILIARPIWYSPTAPILFILSAVAAVPSLTMLLTIITGWLRGEHMVPDDVIDGIAKFVGFVCLAYLYMKLWGWVSTNYYSRVPQQQTGLEILAQYTPYNYTFWFGEVIFGALVPAIFMLWKRLRQNRSALVLACFMIIAGLLINRWNMTLSGFVIPLNWSPGVSNPLPVNHYEPSLVEWGVAVGVIGYAWLAYTIAVRFLKLYPNARRVGEPEPVHMDEHA